MTPHVQDQVIQNRGGTPGLSPSFPCLLVYTCFLLSALSSILALPKWKQYAITRGRCKEIFRKFERGRHSQLFLRSVVLLMIKRPMSHCSFFCGIPLKGLEIVSKTGLIFKRKMQLSCRSFTLNKLQSTREERRGG